MKIELGKATRKIGDKKETLKFFKRLELYSETYPEVKIAELVQKE